MKGIYIHHNLGELPLDRLPAINRGLLYGDGFFTTMRIHRGKAHLERMLRTAEHLAFSLPGQASALPSVLREHCHPEEDVRCRITVFRSGEGKYVPESTQADLLITWEPLPSVGFQWQVAGSVGICDSPRLTYTSDTAFKLINKVTQVRAAGWIRAQGIDDAILLNDAGRPATMLSSNLFAVIGDRVLTPPLTEGCLEGVVRGFLLEQGMAQEALLTIEAVWDADELFATNSVWGIRPMRLEMNRETARTKVLFERLCSAVC